MWEFNFDSAEEISENIVCILSTFLEVVFLVSCLTGCGALDLGTPWIVEREADFGTPWVVERDADLGTPWVVERDAVLPLPLQVPSLEFGRLVTNSVGSYCLTLIQGSF